MKRIMIIQTNCKIKNRNSITSQNLSKVWIFFAFSSIVARRRGCQLATTVPVLLFTWAKALCYELQHGNLLHNKWYWNNSSTPLKAERAHHSFIPNLVPSHRQGFPFIFLWTLLCLRKCPGTFVGFIFEVRQMTCQGFLLRCAAFKRTVNLRTGSV